MRKITLGVICVTVLMVGAVLVVSRSDAAPPSKWKAVILPSANLSGDPARYQSALGGDVYDDAESNVDVYATMGSMATGPYWTVFQARCPLSREDQYLRRLLHVISAGWEIRDGL